MLTDAQKAELAALVDAVKPSLEAKVEEFLASAGGGMYSQEQLDAAVANAIAAKQAELDAYKQGVRDSLAPVIAALSSIGQ